MFAVLLLQVLSLAPPAPSEPMGLDSSYQEAIANLAAKKIWPQEQIQALSAKTAVHEQTLALLVLQGTDNEVRLAALLGADCEGSAELGHAFWRRALLDFDSRRTLACLLAPQTVPQEVFPALAWLATDADRSLEERAAACARLIDADFIPCWPLVAAMLRTGTASDQKTELADWARKGRYELPKRLLLLSLQAYLQRHQLPPTSFEPNSAWKIQEEVIQQLASTLHPQLQEAWLSPHPLPQSWLHLQQLDSSEHAKKARSLLGIQ